MAELLLRRIEAFLKRSGMRPSTFGRVAVRDGLLVPELRRGRRAGPRLERRIDAFLDQAERETESRQWRRR